MNNIEKERRLEKQKKNELITNVSQDLRTPLTSIRWVTCDYFEILNMKIKNNMMRIQKLLLLNRSKLKFIEDRFIWSIQS